MESVFDYWVKNYDNKAPKEKQGLTEYQLKNIDIYNDTIDMFSKPEGAFYGVFPPQSIVIHKCSSVVDPIFEQPCRVEVFNTDTFTLAEKYIDEGLNPVVLNMASHLRCGGGVKKGSNAQEENLFRRSNYCFTLAKDKLPRETYPLKGTTVIYSPSVFVVKDANYERMSNPFMVSVLACPAIRNPSVTQSDDGVDSYKKKVDYELMRDKIEMCYKVAASFGHDSLVLGALGSGAFRNPPAQVALIFKEFNEKYKRHFVRIGFAILSDSKSEISNYANDNFNIFNKILH